MKIARIKLMGFTMVWLFGLAIQANTVMPEWQADANQDFTMEHESNGLADAKVQPPQKFSGKEMILYFIVMTGSAGWLLSTCQRHSRAEEK